MSPDQMALFPDLYKREKTQLKPDAWHIPDFLPGDRQVELVAQIREWTAGAWHKPALKGRDGTLGHAIACLGLRWRPYEYYEGDRPFPIQLYFLARQAVHDCYGPDAYRNFYPDTAICNWYAPGESLGLHVDQSEELELQNQGSPIVTISLGQPGICVQDNAGSINGPVDFTMRSGDVWVMGGNARKSRHGFKRVLNESSPVEMSRPGRLSITIRQARAIARARPEKPTGASQYRRPGGGRSRGGQHRPARRRPGHSQPDCGP